MSTVCVGGGGACAKQPVLTIVVSCKRRGREKKGEEGERGREWKGKKRRKIGHLQDGTLVSSFPGGGGTPWTPVSLPPVPEHQSGTTASCGLQDSVCVCVCVCEGGG